MSAQLGWESPPSVQSQNSISCLMSPPSLHSPRRTLSPRKTAPAHSQHYSPAYTRDQQASGGHSEQPQETALNLSQEPHQARRKSLKCVPLGSSRVWGKGQNISKELKTVYQTSESSKKMLNFSPKCWVRAGTFEQQGRERVRRESKRGPVHTSPVHLHPSPDDSAGRITLNWK